MTLFLFFLGFLSHKFCLNFLSKNSKEQKILDILQKTDKIFTEISLLNHLKFKGAPSFLQKYSKFVLEIMETECLSELKNVKLWNQSQAKFINHKLWHTSESESKNFYKVEKQEDSLRRKFFLRRIKNQKEKEYLSDWKYKESLRTFSKKKETLNSPFDEDEEEEEEEEVEEKKRYSLKRPSKKPEKFFSYLRDSLNSVFLEKSIKSIETKRISICGHYFEENVSKDVSNILKEKKNKHFLLKEQEETQPFFTPPPLAYFENQHLMDYKYKCFAEKISLKGAVWGQLIILTTSFIFCSLNDERPDDDPFK